MHFIDFVSHRGWLYLRCGTSTKSAGTLKHPYQNSTMAIPSLAFTIWGHSQTDLYNMGTDTRYEDQTQPCLVQRDRIKEVRDLELNTYSDAALGRPLNSQILSCFICKRKEVSAQPSIQDCQGPVTKIRYETGFSRTKKAYIGGLTRHTYLSGLFNTKI